MQTFPYDPTTGKRLMRSGFSINPIQPMTQEEVDRQHELVSAAAKEEEIYAQGGIDPETPDYCYVPGFRPY